MAHWFSQRDITRDRWKRELLPEELAFFFDDEHAPDPLTTVSTWESKRHNTLIFGLRDRQVEDIRIFALYREKVGKFPTQPPKWWKPDGNNTATEEAFLDAFSPFIDQLKKADPFTAAQMFTRANAHTIVDQETQNLPKLQK